MNAGLASLTVPLSTAKAVNDVSTAVLAKALDNNRAYGEGLIELIDSTAMERSVNPSVGGNIDVSV